MVVRRIIVLSCAALAATGCGSAGKGKLSSAQGERLQTYVDRAEKAFDDQQCADAREAAGDGARRVARLKGDVDDDLRQNLIDGFNHLESQLGSNCDKAQPSPTASTTATEAATDTPTATATATAEPTESPTATATATEAPSVSATPDTGGTDPGGGTGAVDGDPGT